MKKILLGCCCVALVCALGLLPHQAGISRPVNALQTNSVVNAANDDGGSQGVTPRGIFAALSLSINSGDGKVWATAKNDFTLFPATVIVIVELYSSDVYYESHTQMTLTSRNTIDDLNIGNTLVAEASTGGVQKYWQARMRYKVDNRSWKEEVTDSLLIDGDGNYIKEY